MSFDTDTERDRDSRVAGAPRRRGARRVGAADESGSSPKAASNGARQTPDAPAILVVEDEALNALYISSVLEVCGYEVIGVTATAAGALEAVAGRVPDLVLMDITLRGEVDGIAAARSLQRRLGVPILFVTAHADAPTLARARATNPAGYLIKPFTAQQLEAAVRAALANASPPGQGSDDSGKPEDDDDDDDDADDPENVIRHS